MNLERTKPETLAAGVMDYMPQSLAAHEYAERLNAALARLGLTDRLTLPPAPHTAIDELPGVVDVPLRKTLSVLMGKAQQGDASALATLEWTAQVAESIFAGLHARASVYPLALPSAESLATLAQGVDALLPRKISTGWSVASLLADPTCDGIDDGVSLVRLLCSDAIDSVTELKDDNEGWVMTKALSNAFTNLADVELGCGLITSQIAVNLPSIKSITFHATKIKYSPSKYTAMIDNLAGVEELHFPELKTADFGSLGYLYRYCPNVLSITFPELETISVCNESCLDSTTLKEFIAPKLNTIKRYNIAIFLNSCTELEKVVVHHANIDQQYPGIGDLNACPNLIHLEFAEGMSKKIYIPYWIPTNVLSDSERLPVFLSNFKTYIAERLTDEGSGLTLTLSQAVRDAIEGDPTIAQIITSKGWTISPAPTA